MANRRGTDSQQPSRAAPPPAALANVKPAKATPGISEKKSAKRQSADPLAGAPQTLISAAAAPEVSPDERRGMIAYAAYLRGERRGFPSGGEAEDWLAAEQEIDALLSKAPSAAQ
ncbi:MAG TPA: DUF2934 domain-containing protein [Steroidobacteraceae bacterium]|jgi:hypothetical protein